MDIQRAIAYIEQHGTPLERARLAAIVQASPAPNDVLENLLSLQNSDGGWPLDMQKELPSTLNHTCIALYWLAELDEVGSAAVELALRFLVARQGKRGIWRESPPITAYRVPPWMDPGSSAADIYTTALCASTLVLLGDDYDLDADRAVLWLQSQVGREGLLPGFRLHSTWIALPAFVKFLGHKSKTTRRMVIGLAGQLSPQWEGSMVAWMLNSLLDAGYQRTTQLVERTLALLDEMQRPDGSWSSEDEGGEVQATLQAIRGARRLGLR